MRCLLCLRFCPSVCLSCTLCTILIINKYISAKSATGLHLSNCLSQFHFVIWKSLLSVSGAFCTSIAAVWSLWTKRYSTELEGTQQSTYPHQGQQSSTHLFNYSRNPKWLCQSAICSTIMTSKLKLKWFFR